jgi:dihydrolipoamide dehydrogenase
MRVAVIGAGPGGEAAAKEAARRGARVTLIEKAELGGTCLNRGCIPSKVLLEGARRVAGVRAGKAFLSGDVSVRWDDLQKKKTGVLDGVRNALSAHLKKLGVEVVKGDARFKDAHTLMAAGTEIPFDVAVVAVGSSPFFPEPFSAFRDGLMDSSRALSFPRVPKSLIVVGGGAVGCEFACLFHELGARVTLLEKMDALLPGEDPAVVRVLRTSFEKRGIRVLTGAVADHLAHEAAGWTVRLSAGEDLEAEEVLVCVGRRPDVGGLDIAAAGIVASNGRISVDERMRTNLAHIYAVGDVNGMSLLAHAASAQAETAVAAIFDEHRPYDGDGVPRCLYTWPEVASVGLSPDAARARGCEPKSQRHFFQGSPKALAADEGEGFLQIVSEAKDGRLLGAQIIGPHATELIHVFSVALKARLTTGDLRTVMFAHPTLCEGIRDALSR